LPYLSLKIRTAKVWIILEIQILSFTISDILTGPGKALLPQEPGMASGSWQGMASGQLAASFWLRSANWNVFDP